MRCSTSKRCFSSQLDARITLAKLTAKDRDEKRIYKCNICKRYHITSQQQRSSSPLRVDT